MDMAMTYRISFNVSETGDGDRYVPTMAAKIVVMGMTTRFCQAQRTKQR